MYQKDVIELAEPVWPHHVHIDWTKVCLGMVKCFAFSLKNNKTEKSNVQYNNHFHFCCMVLSPSTAQHPHLSHDGLIHQKRQEG